MLPPYYTLFWLLFSLGYSSPACAAAYSNTLMTGEALTAGERLISSNGKFALGFFQTGSSKYSGNITLPNWYLGIWFNKIPKFTAVWVANRDKPISKPSLNQSIKLTVSGDGKLVLINHATNSEIWSTQIGNRTKASTKITAVLSDNGNLVVQDASKPARIWWQSFDHPTDVILPGGKIGRNKVTGLMYSLVSKMNSVDPASGSYCMELDPSSPKQYVDKLCNTSIVYFNTGEWNGRYFPSVPEMSGNAFATAKFVETHEEEYLTYHTFNETVTTICLLDSDGLTKQLIWVSTLQDWEVIYVQPKASCDVFAVCGPFTVCNDNALPMCTCMTGFSVKSPKDWSLNDRRGGCIRNNTLECSKKKSTKESTDQFFPISSVRLPYDAQDMEAVPTVQECMEICLRDCNCTGYSYSKGVCSIWQGNLVNVKQYNDTTGTNGEILYLRLAAEELRSWENSGRRKMIICVAFGASLSSLVLFVLVVLLIIRRNKQKLCDHPNPNKIKDGGGVLAFGYVDLQRATNNFSEKLGGGGFGNVFKGILSDSNTIAVKTLDSACQGDKQFRAEISTIGMIQHVNLVKLIGFCCERDKRMLVYEHMVNRSLDAHLFRSTGTLLNWSTRYKIAIGIAKGLSYLHENCRDCIIHCDVKPENILLDEAFVPKIADFGMAKLVGREFSRVLTTMRGTIGYLAPEWISGVAITQKVDVYSYGMMLLEIISGRRNSLVEYTSNGDEAIYFPVQAASKLIQGDVHSLLDQQLQGEINMHEVETACKVACWCIQDSEFYRPTMGEVVHVLEGLVDISVPPMPRLLQTILGSSGSGFGGSSRHFTASNAQATSNYTRKHSCTVKI